MKQVGGPIHIRRMKSVIPDHSF